MKPKTSKKYKTLNQGANLQPAQEMVRLGLGLAQHACLPTSLLWQWQTTCCNTRPAFNRHHTPAASILKQ